MTKSATNFNINFFIINRESIEKVMFKNDVIQNQVVSLRALKNQLDQLANALNARPHGALPNDIENAKPKGKEQCQAITLRSGPCF